MRSITHAQVVDAARTWLGTPYHHQARLKGVGVDCIGLVIGVARELALVPQDFEIEPYPISPDSSSLMRIAGMHMTQIDFATAQPGDVIVITFDKDPQHFCILADYRHGGLSIIHAAANSSGGRVIDTRLMFSRALQFAAAFRLPGIV